MSSLEKGWKFWFFRSKKRKEFDRVARSNAFVRRCIDRHTLSAELSNNMRPGETARLVEELTGKPFDKYGRYRYP